MEKSYVIGSNFAVKDSVCDGGSKTLDGFIPIFDATVVSKLKEAGYTATITPIDEFEVANKMNNIAENVAHNYEFGIGADMGGQVRKSAMETKIIGYKPTYGLISRNGLYAIASVFDTVGIYAKDVNKIAEIVNLLKGIDENDMNTFDIPKLNLESSKEPKLFYINEFVGKDTLKNIKASEEKIDINLINTIIPIHNCIMSAEMTTTLANLTGIPFGPSGKGKDADEMMINHRSMFTPVIKKHLIIGTHALAKENLDTLYHNSLRLRGILFDTLNKLMEKYDALITENNETTRLIANLCGYPSIAINDILITGKQKSDNTILNIASMIEKEGD